MSVEASKKALRSRMRGLVRTLDPQGAESAAIVRALLGLEVFGSGRTVMVYLAMAGEPDLRGLWGVSDGPRLCAPRIDWATKRMAPAVVGDLAVDVADSEGPGGIRVPGPGAGCPEVAAEGLDAVIVPGLAFDHGGGRLGRGGGFYDRFLPELPASCARIGVCFEAQIVDCVPTDGHDERVGWLATEDGVRCLDDRSSG